MGILTITGIEFVSVEEVAQEMHIPKRTLLGAVKKAGLIGRRIGNTHYLRLDEFKKWFLECPMEKEIGKGRKGRPKTIKDE